MERAAPHVTGWPAEILGSGDRDMPDATAWERANSISAPIHATTLSQPHRIERAWPDLDAFAYT